eukprot:tig00000113_g5670.t1
MNKDREISKLQRTGRPKDGGGSAPAIPGSGPSGNGNGNGNGSGGSSTNSGSGTSFVVDPIVGEGNSSGATPETPSEPIRGQSS